MLLELNFQEELMMRCLNLKLNTYEAKWHCAVEDLPQVSLSCGPYFLTVSDTFSPLLMGFPSVSPLAVILNSAFSGEQGDETSASLDGQSVHWQPDLLQLSESFE